jgi:hypothetical protein
MQAWGISHHAKFIVSDILIFFDDYFIILENIAGSYDNLKWSELAEKR